MMLILTKYLKFVFTFFGTFQGTPLIKLLKLAYCLFAHQSHPVLITAFLFSMVVITLQRNALIQLKTFCCTPNLQSSEVLPYHFTSHFNSKAFGINSPPIFKTVPTSSFLSPSLKYFYLRNFFLSQLKKLLYSSK